MDDGPDPTSTPETPPGSAEGQAPERVRVKVKVRKRRKPKRWYRRKGTTVALAVGAGLILLLVLDGLWAGVTIKRDLEGARANLSLGADALTSGDLAEARTRFSLAGGQAEGASGALGHPAVALVRALPLLGDDARAISAFSRTAASTSAAGLALVDAANAIGWTGDGASVIQPGGRVNVAGIAAAAPDLAEANRLVEAARGDLEGLDTSTLLGPVRDAAVAGRAELDRVAGITDRAATLAGFLPDVLGAGGQRSYLVVVMTLSDPRGSGGYPGAYGTLRVNDGQLSLDELAPSSRVPVVAPIASQAKPQARYIRFGALTHFIATTYSPNFPDTGALISDMWQKAGRPKVDGVIAVDTRWMSYLLAATGPVSIAGQQEPLTADNVSDVIDRQTLESDSKEASDRVQVRIGGALFDAVLRGGADPKLTAEGMSRAVAERHFQLWMARPGEEEVARDLGATGDFVLGDNPLAVAWDGTINSRTGYFAQKSVSYSAKINADGSADVTIDITVQNLAPPGPPSILLGNGRWMPVGYYSTNASIYLPKEAQDITSEPVGGGGFLNLIEEEFGRPVAFQALGAASGAKASAEITYSLPPPEQPGRFALQVTPLPALNPEQVTVSITTPDGSSPTSPTPGANIDSGTVTWRSSPQVPSVVEVAY